MARIVQGYACPACGHPGPHPVTWHDDRSIAVACGGCGHDFTIRESGA